MIGTFKIPAEGVNKIAVFRALQLGDMLCVIPAVRALRQAYPQAEITLLGLPWGAQFVKRFSRYFDRFVHFPGYPGLPEQAVDSHSILQFLAEANAEKYDLVLQMQGNGTIVNSMIELMGSRYMAGFCLPGDYAPDPDYFLQYPASVHEIERHLQLMNFLGIPSQGTALEFPLTLQDEIDLDKAALSMQAGRYVCVHPGSRGSWRQWPPACFAALADHAAAAGFEVVLTGTEAELPLIQQVEQQMKTRPKLAAGKTTLGAMGLLIKEAALLISNCTGVSHIAAAFATPSVVISMDGEPERWAPLNTGLHFTIDWTQTPDFEKALTGLQSLISRMEKRNHLGHQAVVQG